MATGGIVDQRLARRARAVAISTWCEAPWAIARFKRRSLLSFE
jgi:hypothetical protein